MSNVTKQQIDRIVRQLETVNLRPQMYMDEHLPPVFNFLHGFVSACNSLGVELYRHEDIWRNVEEKRGWKPSCPMWDQLSDAGLTNDEVTQEIIELYIDVCNRIGDTLSQEE